MLGVYSFEAPSYFRRRRRFLRNVLRHKGFGFRAYVHEYITCFGLRRPLREGRPPATLRGLTRLRGVSRAQLTFLLLSRCAQQTPEY